MNDIINCIKSRRSIKKFLPEQIETDKLDAICEAGSYAANGMGKQSGKIVVLQNPDDISRLEKINAAIQGNPNGHPFYGAPTVCVIFADRRVFTYVEDGSLIIGNMLIAAHSLGLGACWIHRAREEFETPGGQEMVRAWGVDAHYVGVGHCILGYAATEAAPPKARKPGFIVKV